MSRFRARDNKEGVASEEPNLFGQLRGEDEDAEHFISSDIVYNSALHQAVNIEQALKY